MSVPDAWVPGPLRLYEEEVIGPVDQVEHAEDAGEEVEGNLDNSLVLQDPFMRTLSTSSCNSLCFSFFTSLLICL